MREGKRTNLFNGGMSTNVIIGVVAVVVVLVGVWWYSAANKVNAPVKEGTVENVLIPGTGAAVGNSELPAGNNVEETVPGTVTN